MNARSKKGALLIELALIIPMVAFVLSAGVTVLLISHRGFKTGTSEFNGSMQASILKSVLDKSIPSAGSITFETPQTGCDALFFDNGRLSYVKGFGGEDEKLYLIGDAKSLTLRIEDAGTRCKLYYNLELNEEGNNRSFSSAIMLLNISAEEFLAANEGVSLPAEFAISAGSGIGMYIQPRPGEETPETPEEPGLPNIYENLIYKFSTFQYWGGFSYTIELTNIGDEPVFGWIMEFDYDGKLNTVNNATLTHLGGTRYRLQSDAYSDVIQKNVTKSCPGSGGAYGGEVLSNVVIKRRYDINNINATLDFKITSQWAAGFNYSITIINNGSEPIYGWSIEFNYDGELKSAWSGMTFEDLGGGRYRISCPLTHTYIIPANGGSVTFTGGGGVPGSGLSVATLNGKSISVK